MHEQRKSVHPVRQRPRFGFQPDIERPSAAPALQFTLFMDQQRQRFLTRLVQLLAAQLVAQFPQRFVGPRQAVGA